jgi:hypothetical protein
MPSPSWSETFLHIRSKDKVWLKIELLPLANGFSNTELEEVNWN